jgi:hypothetical protein
MREIRTSGSMRGGRKRAFRAARLSPTLPESPEERCSFAIDWFRRFRSYLDFALSSHPCLRLQLLHEPIPLRGCRNHYSASMG